ncbi:hypothetical protein ACOJDJ_000125 [Cronobacter dublinensis]
MIDKDREYYINELIMNVKIRHKLLNKLIEYREHYTGTEKQTPEFGKSSMDLLMYLEESINNGTIDRKELRWWED